MRMKLVMRIAARHSRRDGTLTEADYQTIMGAIRHPVRKCKDGSTVNIMDKLETHVSNEMGKQGLNINWDSVIQWFKDHWLEILQAIAAIVTIAVVVLDPGPPAKDEE